MEEDDSIVYGTPSPVFKKSFAIRNSLVHHAKSTGSVNEESTSSIKPVNSLLFTQGLSSQKSTTCISPERVSAQTKPLPLPSDTSFAVERAKAIERKKFQDRISPFKLPKHARSDFVKSSALLKSKETGETERRESPSCSNMEKQKYKRKSGCLDEHYSNGIKVRIDRGRTIGWPSSSDTSSSDDDAGELRFRIKRLKKSSKRKTSKIPKNDKNEATACFQDKSNHCFKTKHNSSEESRIIDCQHTSQSHCVYGNSNVDSKIKGNHKLYQSHSDILKLRIKEKTLTNSDDASPTFRSSFSSPVRSTSHLSPDRMRTDLMPYAVNKSPGLLHQPMPKGRNMLTKKSDLKTKLCLTPEKRNKGGVDNKSTILPGKTTEKALLNDIHGESTDKTIVRSESPTLIDLTSPASDKAVQQIQQLEKDEEVARRLQEELDKEFAMALAEQQEGVSVNRDVGSPVDVSLDQAMGRPTQPHFQWVTPPRHSRGRQTRAPRYFDYEENEIQQMLQHLHSELDVVLQGNPPVPRRRRGRGHGFARMNVMVTPDRAGNDYEELLRLGEMLGDAKKKGLSKVDMNRLPTVTYKKTNSGDPESECHICMCDYEEGDAQRILPCFHSYHLNCIDKWIANNATCPVCRVEIKL